MTCYELDAEKSARSFEKFLSPTLKKLFDATKVVSCENHDSELASVLDQYGGVDALILNRRGIIPIACRIQFDKAYRKFSVRKTRFSGVATEYAKIRRAEANDTIKPLYHVSAYINGDRAEIAVVKTADLMQIINVGLAAEKFFVNGLFYSVDWRQFVTLGYKIKTTSVRVLL